MFLPVLLPVVLFIHSHITPLFGEMTEEIQREIKSLRSFLGAKVNTRLYRFILIKIQNTFNFTVNNSLIYASLIPTIHMTLFIFFRDFPPIAIKTEFHLKINIKFII